MVEGYTGVWCRHARLSKMEFHSIKAKNHPQLSLLFQVTKLKLRGKLVLQVGDAIYTREIRVQRQSTTPISF